MKLFLLTFIFSIYGSSAWAETTSTIPSQEQSTEAETCGPIVGSDSLMQAAQTTAVCSPAVYAYGITKIAPKAFSASVAATLVRAGKYVSVRAAGTLVGGAGIVLTVGDVARLVLSQLPPSICYADNTFKKKMLEMVNERADLVIKESEGLIDKFNQRRMKFPPAYFTDSYIQKLDCSRLANMMRIKGQTQQQAWGEMLRATPPRDRKARQAYPEKIRRIRNKRIPGFHAGAGPDAKQAEINNHVRERDARIEEMKHLVENASCLDMQTVVNVACSIGDFSLYGKVPSAKEVTQWMKSLSPKNRMTRNSARGDQRNSTASNVKQNNPTNEEVLPSGTKLQIDEEFETDINMHVLRTPGTTDQTQNLVFNKLEDSNGNVSDIYIQFLRGDPKVPGAGTALKNNLLRRYPNANIVSELNATNRTRLLRAVENNGYETPSLAELQKVVPALKAQGYDFEINVFYNAGTGTIKLKMRPNGGKPGRLIMSDESRNHLSTLSLMAGT